MRVSFLFSSFRAGGGERVMVTLANAFVAREIPVDAVVLKGVGEYRAHLDARVRIFDLDVWRTLMALPRLVWYLWRERPDAVVATDEYTHLLLLLASRLVWRRPRVILRIGNMFSELYERYAGFKRATTFWLIRHMYRAADAVIANSEGVADDIAALVGLERSCVHVVYNPKPLAFIRTCAAEPSGHPWLDEKKTPIIVAAGRLREQKNFAHLIRAFARIASESPARLVIVGKGREGEKLRALVDELGLRERVSLAGYQDNPYAFLARADAYVHPSLWEGLPNALMEAMACGVPVIAADCPSGPRELLAPGTSHANRLREGSERARYGILVATGDEEALSEVMRDMLGDRAMREGYAAACLQRAEDFDEPKIVDAYFRIIVV